MSPGPDPTRRAAFLIALSLILGGLWALPAGGSPDASQTAKRAAKKDPNPCLSAEERQRLKLLCPRLHIAKPYDMYFERRSGGRLVLRAANSINNVGKGPIEFRGRRDGRITMAATQRIYQRGGGRIKLQTGARLGFKRIPGQYGYWKFRNAARFELWRVNSDNEPVRRVRTGPKLYYCLRDLRRTRPRPRSPRSRVYPACSQDRSRRRVTLGTSVGWSDIYPSSYHEQWIDVTGLHGRFLYVMIVDPKRTIYSTNRRPARASRIVRIP